MSSSKPNCNFFFGGSGRVEDDFFLLDGGRMIESSLSGKARGQVTILLLTYSSIESVKFNGIIYYSIWDRKKLIMI